MFRAFMTSLLLGLTPGMYLLFHEHKHGQWIGMRHASESETDRTIAVANDSAQNAGQAASSARKFAIERIDFSLSFPKPRTSSSRRRFSCKSLPNTCVSSEYR